MLKAMTSVRYVLYHVVSNLHLQVKCFYSISEVFWVVFLKYDIKGVEVRGL